MLWYEISLRRTNGRTQSEKRKDVRPRGGCCKGKHAEGGKGERPRVPNLRLYGPSLSLCPAASHPPVPGASKQALRHASKRAQGWRAWKGEAGRHSLAKEEGEGKWLGTERRMFASSGACFVASLVLDARLKPQASTLPIRRRGRKGSGKWRHRHSPRPRSCTSDTIWRPLSDIGASNLRRKQLESTSYGRRRRATRVSLSSPPSQSTIVHIAALPFQRLRIFMLSHNLAPSLLPATSTAVASLAAAARRERSLRRSHFCCRFCLRPGPARGRFDSIPSRTSQRRS